MNLWTKLRGLHTVGWRNVLLSFIYALRRSRIERSHYRRTRCGAGGSERPPAPARGLPSVSTPLPGMSSAHATAAGMEFGFGDACLDVAFLLPDLVRITWQPGLLPIPYSLARTDWRDVPVRREVGDRGWNLSTAELQVAVALDGGLTFSASASRVLRTDLPPRRNASGWHHSARLAPEEHLFGLGERTAALNLRPGRYRNWNQEAMGSYRSGDDPLYFCVPVLFGIHSAGSYLVFFESSFPSTVTLRKTATVDIARGALRYYFIPGPPARAYERYALLTGAPLLPPRWALGFHQSRWSYKSHDEVAEVVSGFARHDLPLDAVHLDIHYMDGYRVFTVDRQRFPDLAGTCRMLDQAGVKAVAILDPGVKAEPSYDVYAEGKTRNAFLTLPGGREVRAPVWPGMCVFPDFTNPKVRDWWAGLYQRLVSHGIAGIWHDMNEPAAFAPWGLPTLPLPARHDLEGRGGDHCEAHNVYALLEARAGWEGLRRAAPDRRPWILSRSGWAGMQRYAWSWTGDSESNWWTLRQSLRMALSMSMSGIPYNGPDIGGFSGKPDPDLFLRWFELASFLPFFRVHSSAFTAHREPWCFGPAAVDKVRACLTRRRRLLPYWYTLAWQASRTGLPLVRPMLWEAPDDPRWWDVEDQFLVGDSLLVAPVLEPGVSTRKVLLPAGRWYSLSGDRFLAGSTELALPAPHGEPVVLVRAGAILPMQEAGRVVWHAFAPEPEQAGKGSWWNDAGDGYAPGCLHSVTVSWGRPGRLVLTHAREGVPQAGPVRFGLAVHGVRMVAASVDGRALEVCGGPLDVGEFSLVECAAE